MKLGIHEVGFASSFRVRNSSNVDTVYTSHLIVPIFRHSDSPSKFRYKVHPLRKQKKKIRTILVSSLTIFFFFQRNKKSSVIRKNARSTILYTNVDVSRNESRQQTLKIVNLTHLRPHGSVSACFKTSLAMRSNRRSGTQTSQQDNCARLAAFSSSWRRWCSAMNAAVSDSMSSSLKMPVNTQKHRSLAIGQRRRIKKKKN